MDSSFKKSLKHLYSLPCNLTSGNLKKIIQTIENTLCRKIPITAIVLCGIRKEVNVESWRLSPLFKDSKKLMETRKEQSELEKNQGRDVRDIVKEVGNGECK